MVLRTIVVIKIPSLNLDMVGQIWEDGIIEKFVIFVAVAHLSTKNCILEFLTPI